MRILLVTNSYPTKKNPTRNIITKNLYEELNRNGVDTDLVYNQYFRLFKSEKNVNSFIEPILKALIMFTSFLPYIFYRAKKFDIIYVHRPILPGLFMLPSKWLFGVKIVCYVHGSINTHLKKKGFLYKLTGFTLKQCNLVITNSQYMQKIISDQFYIKSKVISPGYNQDVFQYKSTEKKIDLFLVGDAVSGKGIDLLLIAIKENRSFYENNNIHVSIHCAGALKNEYIQYTKKHNLTKIVLFGERLNELKLHNKFRESKIVIMPSKEEALGLVGIEAIASGAFLVASNTGGIKEYVIHGENGYLFEKGDPRSLHFYIKKALNNYPYFAQKQPEPSNTVRQYSLEAAVQMTIDLFHSLIERDKDNKSS